MAEDAEWHGGGGGDWNGEEHGLQFMCHPSGSSAAGGGGLEFQDFDLSIPSLNMWLWQAEDPVCDAAVAKVESLPVSDPDAGLVEMLSSHKRSTSREGWGYLAESSPAEADADEALMHQTMMRTRLPEAALSPPLPKKCKSREGHVQNGLQASGRRGPLPGEGHPPPPPPPPPIVGGGGRGGGASKTSSLTVRSPLPERAELGSWHPAKGCLTSSSLP